MQINVRYLENLRLAATFEDYEVIADQPIRYKGDGSAPGPFDYFLGSMAMCAAYFVKVYCNARNIPTDDIKITQNNIVDPENRYKHTIQMDLLLPDSISKKDIDGMIKSMDRCSVKRVIQNAPEFIIKAKSFDDQDAGLIYQGKTDLSKKTMLLGKDLSLEETIINMTGLIEKLGIKLEIASWRNPVPHVWSVHVRDADSPMCFSNGKGSTKEAALCSALGEYLERLSTNYFYNDFFLGNEIINAPFVHYPDEKWFALNAQDTLPEGLMDENLIQTYNLDNELRGSHLVDTNSGRKDLGICALPYIRQSDQKKVYIPVNLIGNLFVSNGMSAGNSKYEARVQGLSEVFERAIKNKIIAEEITLPTVPAEILEKYPTIMEGIKKLEDEGFPVVVKDASLGGKFPVMCVALMIPETGGVFISFGAHPKFEVALERSLTELMQGRSFEGLKALPKPTFNQLAVTEPNNLVDHFVDSAGVVSWKFFSAKEDYKFTNWNIVGDTKKEYDYLMDILNSLEKEVYIADYDHLGANACRILVPDFSEIYPIEDLIWENHNIALTFRDDILNIHSLDNNQLSELLDKFDEAQQDDYRPVGELIGVAFDDNSVWAELTIGELKALIYLALKNFEEAKVHFEMLDNFSDSIPLRKKFYQLMNIMLDIKLHPEEKIDHYVLSLSKMYGQELYQSCYNSIYGNLKFFGLTPTDMNLKGIDKHQRLMRSYQKLQVARSNLN